MSTSNIKLACLFIYIFGFFSDFYLIFAVDKLIFLDAGLSIYEVVTIVSTWAGIQLVSEVPSGILSDKWNRKFILMLSGLCFGAGFLCWVVIPGFWGFLIGFSVLFGLATSLLSGTDQAYIYDFMEDLGTAERYAVVYGRYRGARFIGVALSWALGGYLSDFSYDLVIYGSIASGFLTFLIATFLLPDVPKRFTSDDSSHSVFLKNAVVFAVKDTRILQILLFSLIVGSTFYLLDEYWPVLYQSVGFSNTEFGIIVSASAVMGSIGSMLAHRVARQPLKAVFWLSLVIAVVFIVAGFFHSKWIAVATVFTELILAMIAVLSSDVIQHAARQDNRATLASINALAAQAFVATGFVFGYIVSQQGIQTGYLYMGLFCLLYPLILIGLRAGRLLSRAQSRIQGPIPEKKSEL